MQIFRRINRFLSFVRPLLRHRSGFRSIPRFSLRMPPLPRPFFFPPLFSPAPDKIPRKKRRLLSKTGFTLSLLEIKSFDNFFYKIRFSTWIWMFSR